MKISSGKAKGVNELNIHLQVVANVSKHLFLWNPGESFLATGMCQVMDYSIHIDIQVIIHRNL